MVPVVASCGVRALLRHLCCKERSFLPRGHNRMDSAGEPVQENITGAPTLRMASAGEPVQENIAGAPTHRVASVVEPVQENIAGSLNVQ